MKKIILMLFAASLIWAQQPSVLENLKKILPQGLNINFYEESEIENLLHYCKVYEDKVYCSIGIHPHHASELKPDTIANLKPHLDSKYVRSIGEVGLDYFRNFQSPQIQIKCFETFVELAIQENYPLFLHHREAFNDFYRIKQIS